MAQSITIAISKNAKILALFAIVCTAIVGLVHLLTKDEIQRQQQKQLLARLNSIIAVDSYNNDIYQDCFLLSPSALNTNPSQKGAQKGTQKAAQKVYRARLNDSAVAAAITTIAPNGYNGNIELLVAIKTDGSVSGVRTLKHNETPGLGDKIELRKSTWIESFNGKKLLDDNDSRWQVVKDGGVFDQFTGATITPRAVVGAVRKTLSYFNRHQAQIFSAPSNCDVSAVQSAKSDQP